MDGVAGAGKSLKTIKPLKRFAVWIVELDGTHNFVIPDFDFDSCTKDWNQIQHGPTQAYGELKLGPGFSFCFFNFLN